MPSPNPLAPKPERRGRPKFTCQCGIWRLLRLFTQSQIHLARNIKLILTSEVQKVSGRQDVLERRAWEVRRSRCECLPSRLRFTLWTLTSARSRELTRLLGAEERREEGTTAQHPTAILVQPPYSLACDEISLTMGEAQCSCDPQCHNPEQIQLFSTRRRTPLMTLISTEDETSNQ